MGKTHYAFAALFTAGAAPAASHALGLGLTPAELAVGVGIGTIAGVLPDIDHPDSMITKGGIPGTKRLGMIGKALGWFLSWPPRVVGVGARATMNHRGGTHSALFMLGWTLLAAPLYAAALAVLAIVFAPLSVLLSRLLSPILKQDISFTASQVAQWLIAHTPSVMPLVMLCVFLGYFAHLFSDSMTKVPVPWPWPFSKARWFVLPKPLRVTTDSSAERMLIRPIVTAAALIAFIVNIGIPLGREVLASKQARQVQRQLPIKQQPKKPSKKKHVHKRG